VGGAFIGASNQSKGHQMIDDDDDYEHLFDILYTVFGVLVLLFAVIGFGAIFYFIVSLL
jgi:hypothetical protein